MKLEISSFYPGSDALAAGCAGTCWLRGGVWRHRTLGEFDRAGRNGSETPALEGRAERRLDLLILHSVSFGRRWRTSRAPKYEACWWPSWRCSPRRRGVSAGGRWLALSGARAGASVRFEEPWPELVLAAYALTTQNAEARDRRHETA